MIGYDPDSYRERIDTNVRITLGYELRIDTNVRITNTRIREMRIITKYESAKCKKNVR